MMKERVGLRRAVALALALFTAAATAGTAPYPEPAQAAGDIKVALKQAGQSHKRVLVDFGANWCADCQLLEADFHQKRIRNILETSYVLVHVNIGRFNTNVSLAKHYGIDISKGVPALAVLDVKGRVIHAQRNGEFESMRSTDATTVLAFLRRWSAGQD